MYPIRAGRSGLATSPGNSQLLAPTFVEACFGTSDNLAYPAQVDGDPRAQQAEELMVRLLREKSAYEANVFGQNNVLLSSSVFPFFYALAGSRNPKQAPPVKEGSASQLAVDAFVALQKHGPLNKEKLAHLLGGAPSEAALGRALNELWLGLRITRVDYVAGEGAYWDVLYRWAPEAVREGARISIPEAVSALISQYLQCTIAADQNEIENFLNVLVPRTRVKEVIKALLAGRELEQIPVGSRTLLKLAGEPVPESPAEPLRMDYPFGAYPALPRDAPRQKSFSRTASARGVPRATSGSREQRPRPKGDKPGSVRSGGTGRRSGKFPGSRKPGQK